MKQMLGVQVKTFKFPFIDIVTWGFFSYFDQRAYLFYRIKQFWGYCQALHKGLDLVLFSVKVLKLELT